MNFSPKIILVTFYCWFLVILLIQNIRKGYCFLKVIKYCLQFINVGCYFLNQLTTLAIMTSTKFMHFSDSPMTHSYFSDHEINFTFGTARACSWGVEANKFPSETKHLFYNSGAWQWMNNGKDFLNSFLAIFNAIKSLKCSQLENIGIRVSITQ